MVSSYDIINLYDDHLEDYFMKLATLDSNVFTNVPAKGSFKITASPKAFKILSSGLYSDKILAVVRELSTNAFDAHASIGKHSTPFEIHLPTTAEPWFSVEDFGCGMTEELVDDVYTTYFGSTKAETNNEAGFMGLGSKSPFSYTDSFTVQTIRDGIKLIYTMALSASGEPSPHLMIKQSTDQANGTKVTVPVDRYDFGRFIDAAKKTFRTFSVKPIIYGADDHIVSSIIEEQKYIFKNDVYGIRDKSQDRNGEILPAQIWAIQGPVGYRLSMDSSGLSSRDMSEFAFEARNMDIFFPIGQLDITASRESISYDVITKSNIVSRVNEINSRIVSDAQEYITEAPNLFDAHKRANEIKSSGCIVSKRMQPMYNGKPIINWGAHYEFESYRMMDGFSFYSYELKSTRRKGLIRIVGDQISNHSLPIVDYPYFFNDLGRSKGVSVYRKYIKDNGIKSSLFLTFAQGYDIVGADAIECMNWIAQQIPGINIIPLSSLPVIRSPRKVREKSSGLPATKIWKYVTSDSLVFRGKMTISEVSEPDVAMKSNNLPRIYINANEINSYKMRNILKLVSRELNSAGLSNYVYLLTKTEYNMTMKGSVVWIHARDFLKSMITPAVVENIHIHNAHSKNNEILETIHWSNESRKKSLILSHLGISGGVTDYPLTSFENSLKSIRSDLELSKDSSLNLFGKSDKVPEIDVSAWHNFLDEAVQKYPMLKYVNIKEAIGNTSKESDILEYIKLLEDKSNA